MKVGYARVSTEEQFLDLQLSALKHAGCDTIFSDHGVSGTRKDRQGLNDALAHLARGDTLVVWRLDRLGRSLSQLVILMSGLRDRGVHFVSLNESIDTDSPTGMFMFHMIAALAEFERALISERTKAGLAAARHRGSKLGRPRALSPQELAEAKDLVKTYPDAFVAKQFGVHVKTLRSALYPRNIVRRAS
ncbi:recombinase family protein [Burkholderia anthina]|uniref:recombinase family protein n=1 Tax=Burkholderia anthina TaxID=179879 RepID=UPI00158C1CF4|nr:recombinase family protein [Burkholderia anthina]